MKNSILLKECLAALFYFFTVAAYHSQTLIIRDQSSGEKLGFSEIIINGNIYYADSSGVFQFGKDTGRLNDVTVKRTGYLEKKVSMENNETDKNVFLEPAYREIEKISLIPKKVQVISDDYKKNSTSSLPFGTDLGYKIRNNFNKEGLLKSIRIPLQNIENNKSYIKLEFYELTDHSVSEVPINTEPIFIPLADLKKGDNIIDLERYKISFPENGILAGIRIIESIGNYNTTLSQPVVSFYNSKKKGMTYYKNQSTGLWEKFNSDGLPVISFALTVLL